MKKKNMPGTNYITVLLVFLSFLLLSCNRDRNNPGWDYFPDMFYSTAYETNSKNPNFSDSMTMRVPVAGTVPRDYSPFNYTTDPESRILAGKELTNPVLPSPDILDSGEEIYTTFCLGCHGQGGEGDGNLYTSGLYPIKPRSLTSDIALQLRDGEIYHSITLGFGSMGAHGSQIRPDERWKLVLYIRKLQQEASALTDPGPVR